jgi:putative addiction module component (TIGR02574 family)
MKTTIDEVRDRAMALAPNERAGLAHDLILSLDSPDSLSLDVRAETEISRRVGLVREGKAKGRPAAQVFRDVEAKYAGNCR